MSFLHSVKSIAHHPLNKAMRFRALLRYVYFHVYCRVFRHGFTGRFAESSTLYYGLGLAGAVGNYYNGLDDYEDMAFLLHYLRESDIFIDVGGNVGSYSVLASGETGCHTVAYEPVKDAYLLLLRNIKQNALTDLVDARNKCVGSVNGKTRVTVHRDSMNRVATSQTDDTQVIEMITLDGDLVNIRPTALKIDVEGYEGQVLKGAEGILSQNSLNILIVELNGSGARYGYTDNEVDAFIREHGFTAYSYHPMDRQLTAMNDYRKDTFNTLYIRDISKARERVTTARHYSINGNIL